jgi:hypothetical protein
MRMPLDREGRPRVSAAAAWRRQLGRCVVARLCVGRLDAGLAGESDDRHARETTRQRAVRAGTRLPGTAAPALAVTGRWQLRKAHTSRPLASSLSWQLSTLRGSSHGLLTVQEHERAAHGPLMPALTGQVLPGLTADSCGLWSNTRRGRRRRVHTGLPNCMGTALAHSHNPDAARTSDHSTTSSIMPTSGLGRPQTPCFDMSGILH